MKVYQAYFLNGKWYAQTWSQWWLTYFYAKNQHTIISFEHIDEALGFSTLNDAIVFIKNILEISEKKAEHDEI